MAHVLVLNSGSSSLKYQLIDMADEGTLARGQVERIGGDDAIVRHRELTDGTWRDDERTEPIADHREALEAVVSALGGAGRDRDLAAVGHRVVHGGDRFVEPTVIDDTVLAGIRELTPLAPLHNPPNAQGIEVARQLWSDVPQIAVFDTAFHATLPQRAYRYAVPEQWYEQHDVRRYGFHGTSHAYVAHRAAAVLGRPLDELRMVTAHLGNGVSLTAVDGGRSVDTSMGLSPLEGLVMGTRSGDVDATVVFHMVREAGLSLDDVEHTLNRASGLLGLCGDNDLRTIERRAAEGDDVARLALDVFCYRIRKYVGAYAASLSGLDVLVFTAGIGEHSPTVRRMVCAPLAFLGIALDDDANERSDEVISADGTTPSVLVVPTDEEREIARQSLAAVSR
jgi:acetate kinase